VSCVLVNIAKRKPQTLGNPLTPHFCKDKKKEIGKEEERGGEEEEKTKHIYYLGFKVGPDGRTSDEEATECTVQANFAWTDAAC
jgi:hypothetical protein